MTHSVDALYLLLLAYNYCTSGFVMYRARRVLENRQNMDDDRMGRLETSMKEAQATATESDKKYEEVN